MHDISNGASVGTIVADTLDMGMSITVTVTSAKSFMEKFKCLKGKSIVDFATAIVENERGGGAEKYSPVKPGPLSEEVANSFNGATYRETVLSEDSIMYRVSGGNAKQ